MRYRVKQRHTVNCYNAGYLRRKRNFWDQIRLQGILRLGKAEPRTSSPEDARCSGNQCKFYAGKGKWFSKQCPTDQGFVEHLILQAQGGTILGSSRGGSDTDEIVSSIKRMRLDMVFVIGGNGSHAGALAITRGCEARGIKCAIVGIPKTIDNDILMIDRTFGFDTAVEQAQMSIRAAAVEAQSAQRGIGVVKLMGRSSGFIAMHSTLASGEVLICLIRYDREDCEM